MQKFQEIRLSPLEIQAFFRNIRPQTQTFNGFQDLAKGQ